MRDATQANRSKGAREREQQHKTTQDIRGRREGGKSGGVGGAEDRRRDHKDESRSSKNNGTQLQGTTDIKLKTKKTEATGGEEGARDATQANITNGDKRTGAAAQHNTRYRQDDSGRQRRGGGEDDKARNLKDEHRRAIAKHKRSNANRTQRANIATRTTIIPASTRNLN